MAEEEPAGPARVAEKAVVDAETPLVITLDVVPSQDLRLMLRAPEVTDVGAEKPVTATVTLPPFVELTARRAMPPTGTTREAAMPGAPEAVARAAATTLPAAEPGVTTKVAPPPRESDMAAAELVWAARAYVVWV